MKINNLKINNGFTIIETLVAITILMISIAGPLTIAQKSLMAATYARDQVTASFLAQDLMEDVKNNRDNYLLINGTGSLDTWANAFSCGSCGLLNIQADGTYGTGSGTSSKFTRNMTLTSISSYEKKLIVTVSWNNGTIVNIVTIENHLFDVVL